MLKNANCIQICKRLENINNEVKMGLVSEKMLEKAIKGAELAKYEQS